MPRPIMLLSSFKTGYHEFDGEAINAEPEFAPQMGGHPTYFFGVTTYKGNYLIVRPGMVVTIDALSKREIAWLGIPAEYELKFPHHVVVNNNILYIADTGHDRVIMYDFNSSQWSSLVIADGMGDGKHVNSLAFQNDLMYVMCHNRGPSEIQVFQGSQLIKTITDTGTMSHDMFWQNGELWYCDSGANGLASTSGKKLQLKGFTRGVFQAGGEVFVGVSVDRRLDDSAPFDDTVNGIYVIDGDTMTVKEFIKAPDNLISVNMLIPSL